MRYVTIAFNTKQTTSRIPKDVLQQRISKQQELIKNTNVRIKNIQKTLKNTRDTDAHTKGTARLNNARDSIAKARLRMQHYKRLLGFNKVAVYKK